MKTTCRGIITIVAILGLGTFASASMAQTQLAKQGQPRGHAGFYGKGSSIDFGNGYSGWVGEFWGASHIDQGKGLLHNAAWYCSGEWSGGKEKNNPHGGFCRVTDPEGDVIYLRWQTEELRPLGSSYNKGTYLAGTGKYKGITGYYLFEVKFIADGVWSGDLVGGEYKLP